MEFLWIKVGRWWGGGLEGHLLEVDVVAESANGQSLLVGEAKLSLSATDAWRVLKNLEAKAPQLPFAGKYSQGVSRLLWRSTRPGAQSARTGANRPMKGIESMSKVENKI